MAGLPSSVRDDDEDAKRFDLLVLRRQLAQLDGDAVAAERLRETIQAIAGALLGKTAIPSVAEQAVLLESVAGDEWWIDVTLPMLELARLRIRGLVRFVEKTRRSPVYTDFEDELSEASAVDLPGVTPGTELRALPGQGGGVPQRARGPRRPAAAAPQQAAHAGRPRLAGGDAGGRPAGGRSTSPGRLSRPAGSGCSSVPSSASTAHAATEAFARYLDGTSFSVDQVRFVSMIVDELTANGIVEPRRLFESPYTDRAPTGPDFLFPDADVEVMVGILHDVKQRALPIGAA